MSKATPCRRALVLVLGDLGRSPRMLYHALALAEHNAEVVLIGYAGSELPEAVRDHPRIVCRALPLVGPQPSRASSRRWFLGLALFKVLTQSLQLLQVLVFGSAKPDFILVQTPPAIPTFVLVLLAARLRRARLVIDWHNFGYAMLSLKTRPGHPVVRLARCYERALGRFANAHLCVSQAMRAVLAQQFGIRDATVLYDRPADGFSPTPPDQRRDLLRRLVDQGVFPPNRDHPDSPQPAALIVSSTSWTEDEDFDLLLDAAVRCDALIRDHMARTGAPGFPTLAILISGRGRLRNRYEARIEALTLKKIYLRTLWLSAEDYPRLLGAANLGLCLHRSASGVDLPMKIADMLGSGLPVCALDYGPCLSEQLRHQDNGLLFSSSTQLAEQLFELFKGFPDTPGLDRLRRTVIESRGTSWSQGWVEEALPVFTAL